MNLDLDSCEEYQAALNRERFLRDSAFLALSESVAGFELRPLTQRMMLTLQLAKSPLVYGGAVSVEHLCAFLWLCSVENSPNERDRKRFYKRCRKLFVPRFSIWRKARALASAQVHTAEAILACRNYISEALMDSPPSQAKKIFQPEYYSDAAYICARFAREYGFSPDTTLDMPLKQLWQFVNETKEKSGSKTLFNPLSDPVRREFVNSINCKTA